MASTAVRRLSSASALSGSPRPHRPPTLTMVLEAVKVLQPPNRKGVSAFAIRRYILHQYPSVDPVRLKYYLKLALTKGLKQGYLVRPPKSSARGVSGSFQLGKEKAQQRNGHEKKFSDEEAKPKVAVTKQPKAQLPKQKSKSKGAVQAKTSSKKPSAALDDGGAAAPGVEPTAKASKKKATKAAKSQGAPKASQVKATSRPKKAALKTKAELKGLPEANIDHKPSMDEKAPKASQAKSTSSPKKAAPKTTAELKGLPEAEVEHKPSPDEKAKRGIVPKGAIARSRAASETKAARAKGKPQAKKGAAKE